LDHFNNAAAVNGWDVKQKLLWLKVRMTRRAQAFPQLNTEAKLLLTLQQYMGQIAFAVKKRHPTTVKQAAMITLELELFLGSRQLIAQLEEARVVRLA